jgi:hypothetical protein
MVTMGILPYQGKIPMLEPGIESGTSCLVVRNSDHDHEAGLDGGCLNGKFDFGYWYR